MKMPGPVYPFTAIVGQEEAKSALILNAVDPLLGGVLILGPKGSGKSTLVRALEDLLPASEYVQGCSFNCNPGDVSHLCPHCKERLAKDGKLPVAYRRMNIVDLPVSATEDGLLGTIDAETAFLTGKKMLQPGLLSRANQNILYIDQINLLPSHLVDCVLDPAASGWVVVQREGLSLTHPSHFALVASMNPEEGELRPQILDRFALRVEMEHLTDPRQREEVVRRNLAFEEAPVAFYEEYEKEQTLLKERIQQARDALPKIRASENIVRGIAEACSRLKVQGVRSDIAALKASRALAAFHGKDNVEPEHVMTVFKLALSHRIGQQALPSERGSVERELRRILFRENPMEETRALEQKSPMPSTSQEMMPSPRRVQVRKRRIPWLLNEIIYIAILIALVLSLGVTASLTTLLLQVMLFGMPVAALANALTIERVLLHLAVIVPAFLISTLISRTVRRPIIYLYTYLGSGLRRHMVLQQEMIEPKERPGEPKIADISNIINIPVYASIRRLYKMIVEKGVKLLDVGKRDVRRRYKFLFERRGDRSLRSMIGKRSKTKARSERGRYVSYEFPKARPWDVALGATIRAAAPYQRSRDKRGLALKVDVEDIRVKVREMRAPITMVLLLDMSESMVPSLVNVKNAILSMHDMANKRRDRVGLVIFKGQDATTLQSPTTNLNIVVKKLMQVGASDLTPLASGMYEAWRVLRNERNRNRDIIPVLVIISDGIANIPLASPLSPHTRMRFVNQAQADVLDAAALLQRDGVKTLIINPSHALETGVPHKADEERATHLGKRWLEPSELLKEIPRITGGHYYGIGYEGELEQVVLTEAFGLISR